MKLQINLNEEVVIKLTKRGREILDKYLEQFTDKGYDIPGHYMGELVTMQLWEFANIFGNELYSGAENVSQDNIIVVQV